MILIEKMLSTVVTVVDFFFSPSSKRTILSRKFYLRHQNHIFIIICYDLMKIEKKI